MKEKENIGERLDYIIKMLNGSINENDSLLVKQFIRLSQQLDDHLKDSLNIKEAL